MQDSWEAGDPYEYFMGRWSSLVSQLFLDWLAGSPGGSWLDVGCGTGALSEAVLDREAPARLTALDQSAGFVNSARQRLGDHADCRVGNAMALDLPDSCFDYAISGLMLNFVPDPGQALREMKRVTVPGGTVAIYVWDYAGRMDFLRLFWDAAVELDADSSPLHEGTRFPESNSAGLMRWFDNAGFTGTGVQPLDIATQFRDFDDFWQPFLGGQGPAPTYVQSLEPSRRRQLRDRLRDVLPVGDDGSIALAARAWAARCTVQPG